MNFEEIIMDKILRNDLGIEIEFIHAHGHWGREVLKVSRSSVIICIGYI